MNRSLRLAAFLMRAMFTALITPSAFGAVNVQQNPDGSFHTGVFVNGSTFGKYDIVFIGDGFTAAEQELFNFKVNAAVNALWSLEPYASHMCAFNIWRVNVVSNESGVDHPIENIYKDTELDCRYGDPSLEVSPGVYEVERCITTDSPGKCYEAAYHAPDDDTVFVLVNDQQRGGCAGNLVFSSIPPNFYETVTHELGHKIGELADEYPYWSDPDEPPSYWTDGEPLAANVTTKTAYADIKWNAWIDPGTPLPTTVDHPEGVVGLWEGAKYHSNGIYRPQFICQMRDSEVDFCKVCDQKMASDLSAFEIEPPETFLQYLICSGIMKKLKAFGKQPWEDALRWRIPIPPCLTCPPNEFLIDEVILVMEGLPAGTEMEIIDEDGRIVAEGLADKAGLTAGFAADRTKAYFVDITNTGAPTGQMLSFSSQLLRNGVAEQLPAGP